MEALLQLPQGFYGKLLGEDDWSFVIKLSSLFEGACTQVLIAHANCPAMNDALSRMTMRGSKIKTMVSLGSLTQDQAGILEAIATLRNSLVHSISNVTFSFDGYFERLAPQRAKQEVKLFGHGLKDQLPVGGSLVSRAEFVRANPKVSIWLTSAEVLACIGLGISDAKFRLDSEALDRYSKLAHDDFSNLGLGRLPDGSDSGALGEGLLSLNIDAAR
jgi:hypothetical protein